VDRTPAPNSGLAKVAVQCFVSTFVVKIATFAKPQNVVRYATDTLQTKSTFQKR